MLIHRHSSAVAGVHASQRHQVHMSNSRADRSRAHIAERTQRKTDSSSPLDSIGAHLWQTANAATNGITKEQEHHRHDIDRAPGIAARKEHARATDRTPVGNSGVADGDARHRADAEWHSSVKTGKNSKRGLCIPKRVAQEKDAT
ncbi:hypothetical protein CONPUDRAFT_140480 [Coniophora puteana RWD-64-598 SS2]|uniref:Uncharacterized protein n=1 Tax=Coniophora puteana (strain RWD-64-598) TaxID=741705 RepID=R7SH08_CONPW|nr:uncharacterized protein CONPUDRAFT_140480 [Coniophora puteana RWD-64-598 SS2]EIW74339.1 hypothetical protein CONPUDRAFT_140480 [Coniophora puteana RWD-64-598 SS2]